MKKYNKATSCQSYIYTFGQTGTINPNEKPVILLRGKGSALTDEKAKQRRAKCKKITQVTMLHLIDVAKERNAQDRVKAYWNTYYCQNTLLVVDSRMYAPLCRNRFCTFCCGIRKAELVNKYLPELRNWQDAHFLTLTRLSVPGYKLAETIKEMQQVFSRINARLKKRYQRGTGCKIMGIRSLESNFNATRKTYNPHFHIIVPSSEIAFILLGEWLNEWGIRVADPQAQDVRKVEDTERDLIEVIKYETKIFTDPEPGKKPNKPKKERTYKIYIRALDTIYAAMKGQRLVERFGFNLPKIKKEKSECKFVEDYQIWEYRSNNSDWSQEDYESTLTGYIPSYELENILANHIDTETG